MRDENEMIKDPWIERGPIIIRSESERPILDVEIKILARLQRS